MTTLTRAPLERFTGGRKADALAAALGVDPRTLLHGLVAPAADRVYDAVLAAFLTEPPGASPAQVAARVAPTLTDPVDHPSALPELAGAFRRLRLDAARLDRDITEARQERDQLLAFLVLPPVVAPAPPTPGKPRTVRTPERSAP